jgi:hypothetical protein
MQPALGLIHLQPTHQLTKRGLELAEGVRQPPTNSKFHRWSFTKFAHRKEVRALMITIYLSDGEALQNLRLELDYHNPLVF